MQLYTNCCSILLLYTELCYTLSPLTAACFEQRVLLYFTMSQSHSPLAAAGANPYDNPKSIVRKPSQIIYRLQTFLAAQDVFRF